MHIKTPLKNKLYRLLLVAIGLCFCFNSLALPIMADPLPPSEQKALNEYPNWVADQCDATATASAAPTAGGPINPGTEVPDDQLPGTGNKAKIWNYLIALGFTPVQAAGIYGNIGREGVFDPESVENIPGLVARSKDPGAAGGYGWGLIGFTPGNSVFGTPWNASGVKPTRANVYYISTQLDIVYGYMKNSTAPDGNNMLQEFQNKATSPPAAANAFEDLVENAGVVADKVRDHIANEGMNKFGGGGGAAAIGSSVSGSPGGGGSGSCCAATAAPAGGAPASGTITGDIQALAQQVMSNNNITFDYGPGGKVAANFKRLANGDEAQTDTGRSVDVQPILLVALLSLAQSHKVQVSSLTDGPSHVSPTDPHGMGDAMDLDFLDGTGLNVQSAVDKTVSGLEQALPNGSRFGMGQPFGTQTADGKSFSSFSDNPNSVHFDVVGVDQDDDDAAVAAAGSGGSASPAAGSGSGGTCCPGSGGGGSVTLTGSTPAEQAFNYFVGQGLSPQASAGIVGNMMTESAGNTENLDTHAHNDISGTHDGIVQWSTGRWAALKSHESGDPYALATQLDYVWYELNHSYRSVLGEIKSAGSAAKAATDFNKDYEISGDTTGEREANAQKIFAKYGGGGSPVAGSPVTTTGSCPGTGSTSDISAYKNPLRDWTDIQDNRVDQGVDYSGVGPVYAMGNGTIDYAGTGTGWPGGNFVSYKLTDGPAAGKEVYVAEDCNLESGIAKGKSVTSDTVLCKTTTVNGYIYIETGWAAPGIDNSIDTASGPACYDINNSTSTVYGMNFRDLMKALGVSSNNEIDKPITCSLPSNWPSW